MIANTTVYRDGKRTTESSALLSYVNNANNVNKRTSEYRLNTLSFGYHDSVVPAVGYSLGLPVVTVEASPLVTTGAYTVPTKTVIRDTGFIYGQISNQLDPRARSSPDQVKSIITTLVNEKNRSPDDFVTALKNDPNYKTLISSPTTSSNTGSPLVVNQNKKPAVRKYADIGRPSDKGICSDKIYDVKEKISEAKIDKKDTTQLEKELSDLEFEMDTILAKEISDYESAFAHSIKVEKFLLEKCSDKSLDTRFSDRAWELWGIFVRIDQNDRKNKSPEFLKVAKGVEELKDMMNPPPSRGSSYPTRRRRDPSGSRRLSGGVTWGDNEGVYSDSDGVDDSSLPLPPVLSRNSIHHTGLHRDTLGSGGPSSTRGWGDNKGVYDSLDEYFTRIDLNASNSSKSGSNVNYMSSDFRRAGGLRGNSSKPVFGASNGINWDTKGKLPSSRFLKAAGGDSDVDDCDGVTDILNGLEDLEASVEVMNRNCNRIKASQKKGNSSEPVFRSSKYSPEEVNAAILNYARFHDIGIEVVKLGMVEDSKLGIDGWANYSLPSSQYPSSAAGGSDSDSDIHPFEESFDDSLFLRSGNSGQGDY